MQHIKDTHPLSADQKQQQTGQLKEKASSRQKYTNKSQAIDSEGESVDKDVQNGGNGGGEAGLSGK